MPTRSPARSPCPYSTAARVSTRVSSSPYVSRACPSATAGRSGAATAFDRIRSQTSPPIVSLRSAPSSGRARLRLTDHVGQLADGTGRGELQVLAGQFNVVDALQLDD